MKRASRLIPLILSHPGLEQHGRRLYPPYRNALQLQKARHGSNHAFNQAGGVDHVMYPEYERGVEEDSDDEDAQNSSQKSVITIPTRLKKRLDKWVKQNSSKSAIREQIREASRKGCSTKVIISCKRQEKNHYYGQTYPRGEQIPLASKGWTHKKAASAHDYFSIQPYDSNFALLDEFKHVTFEEVGLSKAIAELLEKDNIRKPTVIQSMAISKVIKGYHSCIASETGSGKTLAYLLPIFDSIINLQKHRVVSQGTNKPLALILLPTRELADQVYGVANKYGTELGLSVKLIQGGNLGSKIASAPTGLKIDIMVATVHVVLELGNAGVYGFDELNHIVLDEADTLLDDSFSPIVLPFLRRFRFGSSKTGKVQLSLVSATMPRSLDTILDGTFPVGELEKIKTPGLHRVMPHVPQKFIRLNKAEKPQRVLEIAKSTVEKKVPLMIFCNKNETVNWLSLFLLENDIACIGLSARLSIRQRKGRIDAYKNGESNILVCTDLASRGIDTINTQHVLHYEFPHFLADYIHRCGRTGRVGGAKGGKVTSFISGIHEAELVQEIEKSVRQQTAIDNVNANIKRLLNVRLGGTPYNYEN